MEEVKPSERMALDAFRDRLSNLADEASSIDQELRRHDLIALAHRTQELIRMTRGLLEGNITILFGDQPPRVPQELYNYVQYAEGHLRKALAEDWDFQVIQRRLSMATTLASHVIREVSEALDHVEDALASDQ